MEDFVLKCNEGFLLGLTITKGELKDFPQNKLPSCKKVKSTHFFFAHQ
jgi:hypothetical protein